jgi:hypothetical protein
VRFHKIKLTLTSSKNISNFEWWKNLGKNTRWKEPFVRKFQEFSFQLSSKLFPNFQTFWFPRTHFSHSHISIFPSSFRNHKYLFVFILFQHRPREKKFPPYDFLNILWPHSRRCVPRVCDLKVLWKLLFSRSSFCNASEFFNFWIFPGVKNEKLLLVYSFFIIKQFLPFQNDPSVQMSSKKAGIEN